MCDQPTTSTQWRLVAKLNVGPGYIDPFPSLPSLLPIPLSPCRPEIYDDMPV